MRIIACIDLDYFYAQCEEILNPNIKDKPIVVCIYSGRGEEGGAVATANYVARRYGVKSGMAISRAKKLLKDAEAFFIPAKLELYEKISTEVMKMVQNYADIFEQVSVDEAFLDITRISNENYEKALELMKEMKKEIFIKEKLTCSVGIGPSKVIAKIASGLNKPNGLTLVKPEDIPKVIWPLPISELPGVGSKTEIIMNNLGIKTIGDLANYEPLKLISVFGKKIASYFISASQGKDAEPVKPAEQNKQFSRMITLKENTLNFRELLPYLDTLAKELSNDLKYNKVLAKGIGITAILDDFSTVSKSTILSTPTNSYEDIKDIAEKLLRELLPKCNKLIRRISLRAYNLIYLYKSIPLLEYMN
jgi:DNA polymerase IV (DinB-like DNA polymerase)